MSFFWKMAACCAAALSSAVMATTFVVNTTDDSDDSVCDDVHCSLREALNSANSSPGRDIIDFGGTVLPTETEPVTITLLSGLPTIVDSVVIDASIAETRVLPGNPARRPGVELDLSAAAPVIGNFGIPFFPSGLVISGPAASGSVVRGLIINGINRASPELCVIPFFNPDPSNPETPNLAYCSIAISIFGADSVTVAGNYLNTDAEGEALRGHGVTGIILLDVSKTRIGGEQADDRNVMTAKDFEVGDDQGTYTMISAILSGWTSAAFGTPKQFNENRIVGNYLGVSASGIALNPNARGIWHRNWNIGESPFGPIGWGEQCDDQISDPCVMDHNIVKGNTLTNRGGFGTFVFSGDQSNSDLIQNIAYNRGEFNGPGIQGTVEIFEDNTGRPNNMLVSKNRFGVDQDEEPATLPSRFAFSVASGDNIRVENNIITGALADGVAIFDNSESNGTEAPSNVTLSQNSIYGNCLLGGDPNISQCQGIDLREPNGLPTTGPTPNDSADPDTGPNSLQNKPILIGVSPGKAQSASKIFGELDSTPNQVYLVEFFSSSGLNPADRGEGEKFIGQQTVTTDSIGYVQFGFNFTNKPTRQLAINPTGKTYITATATRKHCEPKEPGCLYGSTSEFSPACEWDVNNTEFTECIE